MQIGRLSFSEAKGGDRAVRSESVCTRVKPSGTQGEAALINGQILFNFSD